MGLLGSFIGKGENRGKILEALDRPVRSKTVHTYTYGRKGSAHEGKVTEHTIVKNEWSVGDIAAAIIIGGIIYLAAEAPLRSWLWDLIDPLGLGAPDEGVMLALAEAFKEAIDPFDLFAD